MTEKHGTLSIDSENLFPIIKKWLYSDHDIFYRELISNGCDAITKLKKLDMMGEYELPSDFRPEIQVVVDPEAKTISVSDNGLGMTADEVEEYINRIAFSGATDFIEKYKDKGTDDQIIGHFGLGFYSAFMVADQVTIDTLSWQKDASAVHWSCDGGTEFDLSDSDRTTVGTTITLYLNEDCLEFANEYRAREVIQKYCSFMQYPIFLSKANEEEKFETIDAADKLDTDVVVEEIHEPAKTEEKEKEDGTKETVEVSPAKDKLKIKKRPVPLNDTTPLWTKSANDCTDEEYKEFYRKVFNDYKEPLFWIHLNMDYPFNLKGILYFPKINTEYDSIEGMIKLYNNQVFIADNIKEVIPEFLMLLKGVIDCPDLPLNVSRSALQNDGFVTKISDFITKKVADKLSGMCKTEKENYEKFWDDISPFIKFGCLKDTKFCDRMNDYILFKNLEHKYLTLPELLVKEEEAKEEAKKENGEEKTDAEILDKDGNPVGSEEKKEENADDGKEPKDERKIIYYVTDEKQQGQYINMFKENNQQAVILDRMIDTSFITQLEQRNEHYKFCRIDSDLNDSLKAEDGETSEEVVEDLKKIFRKALSNEELNLRVEKLKDDNISSMLTVSEEGRRMQDMMKMYAGNGLDMGMFGGSKDETLILNENHALVQYILEHRKAKNVPIFCEQLYDLAKLVNRPLTPEEMTKFVARSNEIMLTLAK